MMKIKIVPEVLERFEEAGLSREEAERIIFQKVGELAPEKRREELDFLSTPLRLSVKPLSGSVNTKFVFTVTGNNPKKEVLIQVLKGWTRWWDPVIGTILPGRNSVPIKGGQIMPEVGGFITKISPSVNVKVYVRQKSWWFDKKSNPVMITIQKSPPIVREIPLPGMEFGITPKDILPASPPYPPLPNFVIKFFSRTFRRK